MKQKNQNGFDGRRQTTRTALSRRAALRSSGLTFLGLLSAPAFCRAQEKESARRGLDPEARRRREEDIEQSRAFSERMRNAAGMDERMQIMAERRAQQHQRALEGLKRELGISDAEWLVIRPRLETVYNLVHPQSQLRRPDAPPAGPADQKRRELRELLRDSKATTDQITAGLTALRAAREKARQELGIARQKLRQLLTLRQEAQLVLSGLLD
jgi:hypothetical protein